jgi:hypothetical protein
VADSVPVSLSGSDLKAHLIINPLCVCVVSLGSVPPPSPRMSGHLFCPRQRWRTFFPSLWEQMLPQSSHHFLSYLCPPLPPQACPYCD